MPHKFFPQYCYAQGSKIPIYDSLYIFIFNNIYFQDLALVCLDEDITHAKAGSITIADKHPHVGDCCRATGWGSTSGYLLLIFCFVKDERIVCSCHVIP